MGEILAPKEGQKKQRRPFFSRFHPSLHWVSNVGVLPVSLAAFKAFVMAGIALSASFLKKDSMSEKKIVFLHRDMVVCFNGLLPQNF